MRPKIYFSLLFLIACSYGSNAQSSTPPNPLLVHANTPIPFHQVTAAYIKSAVASVLATSDERIKKIAAIPAGKQTVANTILATDELLYDLSDLGAKLGLIAGTYTDDNLRNTANDESEKISLYTNNLLLNEGLYNALKSFTGSTAGKSLKPNHQKFLKETLLSFEKNGMKLDTAGRKQLAAINQKIIQFGTQFDKNIAEHKDSIAFTAAELAGVPAALQVAWQRPGNKYVVYVNGPNQTNILKYADNATTRKSMLLKYNNRAYPKNITVLDSLFYYRQKLADRLNFKSYAEYALVDKMAANPANVWKFENDLISKLTPLVTAELKELGNLKRQLHPEQPAEINQWDLAYYRNKLLDTKYQLNTDEVKQYFEMNNTLQGMFTVYQKLLNIQIKEIKNVPVWHAKVKAYELYKEGQKMGNFYLDLYPRPNKYTHFACFPISQYRVANAKEVLPVSALICNFPEGNAQLPSLLNHSEVITLFHEFGHLVHSLLGRSDLATQGPFYVKGDFVEAPSQFLENWCWEYEPLKIFAKHYKTGQPLPQALFTKMKQTQQVGSGLDYMRQVYLGVLDFTYEDKYTTLKGKDIVEISKDLYKILQVPFTEGSHFITSFGHLNGYAANYYGYLWSRVFAEDMFSVFREKGVMDTPTGVRYRKEILEPAATKDEMDMLRTFLGREPNAEAFMQSLGIKGN